MNELDALLKSWNECRGRGDPAVLATVVKVTGSAYRRPGARMIFPRHGPPAGVVSGGCLETDLAGRAEEVLASGEARIQVYDMRSPDDIVWGLGLGCNGEIRVLLERLDPREDKGVVTTFLAECRASRRPGVVATVFDVHGTPPPGVGDRLLLHSDGRWSDTLADERLAARVLADARACLETRGCRLQSYDAGESRIETLLEYVPPPVSLYVFGAGSDARPIIRMAGEIGWQTMLIDNRPGFATPERFPEADSIRVVEFEKLGDLGLRFDSRSPAIILTHHFLHDLELLEFLLARPLPYLGLLGPRKRTETLLGELESRGRRPDPERLLRLHGPVGLDIGAETPEEIALAVLAEIQAALSGRRGGFLRDRSGPLHDWPA